MRARLDRRRQVWRVTGSGRDHGGDRDRNKLGRAHSRLLEGSSPRRWSASTSTGVCVEPRVAGCGQATMVRVHHLHEARPTRVPPRRRAPRLGREAGVSPGRARLEGVKLRQRSVDRLLARERAQHLDALAKHQMGVAQTAATASEPDGDVGRRWTGRRRAATRAGHGTPSAASASFVRKPTRRSAPPAAIRRAVTSPAATEWKLTVKARGWGAPPARSRDRAGTSRTSSRPRRVVMRFFAAATTLERWIEVGAGRYVAGCSRQSTIEQLHSEGVGVGSDTFIGQADDPQPRRGRFPGGSRRRRRSPRAMHRSS